MICDARINHKQVGTSYLVTLVSKYEKSYNLIYHSPNTIDELKALLRELRKYDGGFAEFNKLFFKYAKLEKSKPKNFPTRIVSGELTFKKSLSEHLSIAIRCANEALDKAISRKEKQFNIDAKSKSLKSVLSPSATLYEIGDFLEGADKLYFSGSIYQSSIMLENLLKILDESKLKKSVSGRYFWHKINLFYIRNISQFSNEDQLRYCSEHLEILLSSIDPNQEPELYFQTLTLAGLLLRQNFKHFDAYKHYTTIDDFIESHFSFRIKEKEKLMYETMHQKGISLMRHGYVNENSEALTESTLLLNSANEYLLDSTENEMRVHHRKMREAESLIKNNQLDKAEALIKDLDSQDTILLLNPPQQSILYRIKTEKDCQASNKESAVHNLSIAIKLAAKHQFHHDLEMLANMIQRYPILKNNINPRFSPFSPDWTIYQ